jgi:hypothetical protein
MALLRQLYARLKLRVNESNSAVDLATNRKLLGWWRNSSMLIHIAFPISYFDRLGIPRLAP